MTYLAYDIERGPIETVALEEYREIKERCESAEYRLRRLKNWIFATLLVGIPLVMVACGGMR